MGLLLVTIAGSGNGTMSGQGLAVVCDDAHRVSKTVVPMIRVVADHGVEGDAHAGQTVQHLSRVTRDPTKPNLRQVHLAASELLDELRAKDFEVEPSMLGEDITTRGLNLFGLPRGTRLRVVASTLLEVTGLPNPCAQIEAFRPNLLRRVARRDATGAVSRRAGIMTVASSDGGIRCGDPNRALLPSVPHVALEAV